VRLLAAHILIYLAVKENIMQKVPGAIESTVHWISKQLTWLSMAMLFLMVLIVTVGVIARYAFNSPLRGDMEVQELMMVVIVFIAFPFCQMEKGNVYVELLVDRLKGRPKAILQSFAYFIGLIIIVLIIWQTGLRAIRGIVDVNSDITLMLNIPIAPFVLIADIGLILFAAEWLIELVHSIHRISGASNG
jgi:TRAP-type C4-dicarboxylate transport system permease small subunit